MKQDTPQRSRGEAITPQSSRQVLHSLPSLTPTPLTCLDTKNSRFIKPGTSKPHGGTSSGRLRLKTNFPRNSGQQGLGRGMKRPKPLRKDFYPDTAALAELFERGVRCGVQHLSSKGTKRWVRDGSWEGWMLSPSQQGPSTPQSFKALSPLTFTPAKSLGIPAWRPSPCQISALRKGDKL